MVGSYRGDSYSSYLMIVGIGDTLPFMAEFA